jgi:HD-GYP domain-containing protein (c-di-GMP phosphodiesterase class II)
MRYVPLEKVEVGMRVGEDLYSADGDLLLAKHLMITSEYLAGLEKRMYPGIYIVDELSEDVEIEYTIRPEVRRKAVNLVHDIFLTENDPQDVQPVIEQLSDQIVGDILCHRDVMCNMMDIKSYDDYTYFHCVNVAVLSSVIGLGFGLKENELRNLVTSAMLHDIGKRFVDIDIINSQRKLSYDEMEMVKNHPRWGYDFLHEAYQMPSSVYLGVLQHHEWYDGSGYPNGAAGDDIHLFGRIISVADVYDALVSKRSYHKPTLPSEAVEYIMGLCGREFDPEVVGIFLKKIAAYPNGVEVELSDGRQALVIQNYESFCLRPRVRIMETGEEVDLKNDTDAYNLTIVDLVV